MKKIKALAGTIKENLNELWTLALITVAVPVIVYSYAGVQPAAAVFVAIQIGLGLFRERFN
jgi:hypothetical protein